MLMINLTQFYITSAYSQMPQINYTGETYEAVKHKFYVKE